MDLIEACRVFVHVGERGSFTLGAAAARTSQSVASRRVAALEEHFGERLFDRTARRAALTTFGEAMLPSARRLVQLAESMAYDAEQVRLRPLAVAVPETCGVRRLADLGAAARAAGSVLEFRAAGPAERAALLGTREVRAALVAVPADGADWVVPLGVATAAGGGTRAFRLDTLRAGRTDRAVRRLWLQPEDDVPHIRDRVRHLGHRAALAPAQVVVAGSLTGAVSVVLRSTDLLLCPRTQADELGLHWRPLAGESPARGFIAVAVSGIDADRLRTAWPAEIARCLGAPEATS